MARCPRWTRRAAAAGRVGGGIAGSAADLAGGLLPPLHSGAGMGVSAGGGGGAANGGGSAGGGNGNAGGGGVGGGWAPHPPSSKMEGTYAGAHVLRGGGGGEDRAPGGGASPPFSCSPAARVGRNAVRAALTFALSLLDLLLMLVAMTFSWPLIACGE